MAEKEPFRLVVPVRGTKRQSWALGIPAEGELLEFAKKVEDGRLLAMPL